MTREEFYKEVVKTGNLERLLVLRTKSGQRAVMENVSELKCPAEFNLSQQPIPQGVELTEKDRKNVAADSVSLVPMSFERRDPGDILEAEPTLLTGAEAVNLKITVSHVTFTKKEKWGKATVEFEQPQFETQKLTTDFDAPVGSPCLIGTLSPPFGNGLAVRTEQNVWFCFITATVQKKDAKPREKSAR